VSATADSTVSIATDATSDARSKDFRRAVNERRSDSGQRPGANISRDALRHAFKRLTMERAWML